MTEDTLPLKIVLYAHGQKKTECNAPNEEQARSVIEWHFKKDHGDSAAVMNLSTNEVREYIWEDGTLREKREEVSLEPVGFVDDVTGEYVSPEDAKRIIKQHESTIRQLGMRLRKVMEDKEAEARATPEWETATILFKYWKAQTGHKNSRFTLDRFETVKPFLKKYALQHLTGAIAGIAYDHFTTICKNGAKEHHDGWELVFRDAAHLEKYANRAPKGYYQHFQQLRISMKRDEQNSKGDV